MKTLAIASAILLALSSTACTNYNKKADFSDTTLTHNKRGPVKRYEGDMLDIIGNYTPKQPETYNHGPNIRFEDRRERYNDHREAPRLNGRHLRTWGGGNSYNGDWVDGIPHGQGVFTMPNGYSYSGDYIDGLEDGRGTTIWPGGDTYIGGFHQGKRHGQGTYRFANGDIYIGEYLNNHMHNKGTYTTADGNYYEGQWGAGKPSGQGKLSATNQERKVEYQGQYKEGAIHGLGYLRQFENGRYTGSFNTNAPEGKGTFISDRKSTSYSGTWLNGAPHGNGVGVSNTKAVAYGNWHQGKLHGDVTLVFSETMTGTATYQHGQLQGDVNLTGSFGRSTRVPVDISGSTYQLSASSIKSLQTFKAELKHAQLLDTVLSYSSFAILFSVKPDVTDLVQIASHPWEQLVQASRGWSIYTRRQLRTFCQFEALKHQKNKYDKKFWLVMADSLK
jgi:hypothetical protein